MAVPACAQEFAPSARFHYFLKRTFGWQRLTVLSGETAFDYLLADPGEWGREPHAYVCRYSSAFGRRLVSNSIEFGVGLALREDTRLRPLPAGAGFGPRLAHAARQSVLTSQGRLAFSRLAAIAGAAWIASRWEPRPMTTSRFFSRLGSAYIGQLENSLLAEFELDLKRWGRRVGAISGWKRFSR